MRATTGCKESRLRQDGPFDARPRPCQKEYRSAFDLSSRTADLEGRLPARQRRSGLIQPEQAKPATDLRLPALRIDRQGSLKFLRGGFEFLLTFQAQRQIVMRGGILRILFRNLRVMVFRWIPILLLKSQMAEAIVNFGCVLAARVLAAVEARFELPYRVVQLSRGCEFNGRSQAVRKSRPLRFRRDRSWIAPQKALDEIVVYEENLLGFVCRILPAPSRVSLKLFLIEIGVTTKSPCKTDCSVPSP